jgi:hypothetical protein
MPATYPPITADLIRAFLADELPGELSAYIERTARESPAINERINAERDAMLRGDHSLGAIWQDHQMSCPTREQLGAFLLDAVDPDHAKYISFHIDRIECHFCQANVDDLRVHLESRKARSSSAAGGKPKRRK